MVHGTGPLAPTADFDRALYGSCNDPAPLVTQRARHGGGLGPGVHGDVVKDDQRPQRQPAAVCWVHQEVAHGVKPGQAR